MRSTLSCLRSECELCGQWSGFTGRTEVRDGRRHAIVRCPNGDGEFAVWRRDLEDVLASYESAWTTLRDATSDDRAFGVLMRHRFPDHDPSVLLPLMPLPEGLPMRADVGGRIEYAVGNPHNPGNPFGRIELTLGGDGDAHLVHLHRGGAREGWRASTDPAVVASILETLALAGFPRVPLDPPPPGTTFRELTVVTDDDHRRADVAWHAVAELAGYREVFAMLDSIVGLMSPAWPTGPSALVEGAVRDIVRIAS